MIDNTDAQRPQKTICSHSCHDVVRRGGPGAEGRAPMATACDGAAAVAADCAAGPAGEGLRRGEGPAAGRFPLAAGPGAPENKREYTET